MTFSEALDLMKDTSGPAPIRVARRGWNGKGMFIYIHHFPGYLRCFVMHTAQGDFLPGWLASQTDLLANDWEVA